MAVTRYNLWMAGDSTLRRGAGKGGLRLGLVVHIALMVGAAVLAAGVSGWGIWWLFGSPDLSGPTDQASRFEVVKLILTVAGSFTAGLGAVIALVVQYRKQHLSEAGERREDTKLFLERYAKAAEQLGSDKAAVRLAGVYAMVSLADDWVDERQTCVDVLCAYIRMPYEPPSDADREGMGERQVRHALLKALADQVSSARAGAWSDFEFDFTGAVIDGGRMELMRVPLMGRVNFDEVRFTGDVHLVGVQLEGGEVSLVNAEIDGGRVDLSFLNATRGRLDCEGLRVGVGLLDLSGATVTDAIFALPGMAVGNDGEVRLRGARFRQPITLGGVVEGGLIDLGATSFDVAPGATYSVPQTIGPLDLRSGRVDVADLSAERVVELGEITFGGGDLDLRGVRAGTVMRHPASAPGLIPPPRRPES